MICKSTMVIAASFVLVSLIACNKEDDIIEDPFQDIVINKKQEAFVAMSTATWCSSCGSWGNSAFEVAFNEKNGIDSSCINGLALHYSGDDSLYCLMAQNIKEAFDIQGTPNLWVEFNNAFNLQPARWEDAIKQRCANTNPVCALGMEVRYQNGTFTLYLKSRFYSTVSGTFNLAVYAVENGVKAYQAGSIAGNNHLHNHILRDEVTCKKEWGIQIINGTSSPEYTGKFIYTPSKGVDPDNLRFIAVIYEMEQGVPVSTLNSNTF